MWGAAGGERRCDSFPFFRRTAGRRRQRGLGSMRCLWPNESRRSERCLRCGHFRFVPKDRSESHFRLSELLFCMTRLMSSPKLDMFPFFRIWAAQWLGRARIETFHVVVVVGGDEA